MSSQRNGTKNTADAATLVGKRHYPTYSREDIAKHNSAESCWIILFYSVYDVTKFLAIHPGGRQALLAFAGKEGTDAFMEAGHLSYSYVLDLMQNFKIGEIERPGPKL